MIKLQFVEKSKIQIFFNKIFPPTYVTVGVKDNINLEINLYHPKFASEILTCLLNSGLEIKENNTIVYQEGEE